VVDSEEKPDGWLGSWCMECGPDVGVDEDGLCTSCGSGAVGDGADEALKARARAEQAETEARGLRSALADMETRACEAQRLREALRTIAVARANRLPFATLIDAIDEAAKLLEPRKEPPRG
jgi:hypothetical protein